MKECPFPIQYLAFQMFTNIVLPICLCVVFCVLQSVTSKRHFYVDLSEFCDKIARVGASIVLYYLRLRSILVIVS
uniref:Putative secreted protein n=1 Tax=Ixodes ricinus TaxID=34613 RepID=A0A6B0U3T0_IXORI